MDRYPFPLFDSEEGLKMIAAFDVNYLKNGSALAAAVVFEDFLDSKPRSIYRKKIVKTAEYVPGSFYKRELPCILEVLAQIHECIDIIIVDGYVFLGERPGLGKYLSESIDSNIAVIGVAKSFFAGSNPVEAKRGKSKNPLFVTALGIDAEHAKDMIESMHGEYRIPTLLKEVDRASKEKNVFENVKD